VSTNDPNVGNTGAGITIKTEVSIYQLHRGKGDFRLLRVWLSHLRVLHMNSLFAGNLSSTTSNAVRWSPRGRFVVLATMGSASKSELQFWDLNFNADDVGRKDATKEEWGSAIQHLGTADHYGVTDVEWDPSGRYLATSASAWKHTVL
jgi:translation initiation factor 3 subunit B